MAQIIQIRRDTSTTWASTNPILAHGEQALETDTLKRKIGNGVATYNELPYEGSLGFTPENVANKQTNLAASAVKYPTVDAVIAGLAGKQPLDTDLTAIAALTAADNDGVISRGTGAWISRTLDQFKTYLGLGSAAYTAANSYDAAGTATSGDNSHLSNFAHSDIAHTNRAALNNVSGTNTGDQDLSGKADLVGGFVSNAQLPAYVDDVLEFANLVGFPVAGETGKIYMAVDTNVVYRWSGSGYVEISASLALGETLATAYRGDRGKIAFDHSQVSHEPVGAAAAGDSAHLSNFVHGDIAHTNRAALDLVSGINTGDQTLASLGAEASANRNATGGYAGLTLFALNLKNAANTFTNFLTNATTAARTWTMPDKDGTVAMTSDIVAGLTNFTEAVNTAAPNNVRTAASLTATGGATDIDAAFVPKGSGGVAAQVALGDIATGNKRGANAVDWQTIRTSNISVASGNKSTIGGGTNNRCTGNNATIGGGESGRATGISSVISGGDANLASGDYSFIGGGTTNHATATYATASGGGGNTADGVFSTIPGGRDASTQGIYGKYAYTSGQFGAKGDCQRGSLTLRRATTDATATVLTSDNAAPSGTNQLTLQNQQMMTIRGQVACRRDIAGGAELAAFEFTAVINRTTSAANTTLHASAITSLFNNVTGLAAAPIALTADTATGSLAVTVTGVAATSLRWLAVVISAELIAAA